MVQKYQSPVRVYKYPFELVMKVRVKVFNSLVLVWLLSVRPFLIFIRSILWKCNSFSYDIRHPLPQLPILKIFQSFWLKQWMQFLLSVNDAFVHQQHIHNLYARLVHLKFPHYNQLVETLEQFYSIYSVLRFADEKPAFFDRCVDWYIIKKMSLLTRIPCIFFSAVFVLNLMVHVYFFNRYIDEWFACEYLQMSIRESYLF